MPSLPSTQTAQPVLTVAAAADLSTIEPALESSFGKTAPDVKLRFVNDASAVLTQQIEHGAPYDVFLSANAKFVDKLGSNGKLVPDSVATYATGRLGLLWRTGGHREIKDLAEESVRILALPNPKLAPYGVAAQQALEHAGIWVAVEPKVVYGENVRQALQLFETGNADAVITSASLLQGKNAYLIPEHWHSPIIQKAGIVADTRNLAAARRFLAFLTTPAGQAVFAGHGYSSATPSGASGRKPPANP